MTKRFPNAYAKDPPPIYDLVAVANHRGGVNGGHYYTYPFAGFFPSAHSPLSSFLSVHAFLLCSPLSLLYLPFSLLTSISLECVVVQIII